MVLDSRGQKGGKFIFRRCFAFPSRLMEAGCPPELGTDLPKKEAVYVHDLVT